MPSIRSCRTIWLRVAPKARRTAISVARAEPRASIMFARFRQPMSKTTPDMQTSNIPTRRSGPASPGFVLIPNGFARTKSRSVADPLTSIAFNRAVSGGSCDCADFIVTPGSILPIRFTQ